MPRGFTSAEIVVSFYRFFLGREPDDEGLTSYCAILEAGAPLATLMKEMASSEEFRDQLYAFLMRQE